ncbi:MAG: filamentous hemagglutinin [Rhodoferax ferrireducens]|uniref:Filamentous hemagglutinin n=1 Tax=Rhodoferax ferrireducens TaxID=192843 RepID=A0A1W9KQV9_9BURK|nr:MAG: filamentous hemagglutinin [Rhodoferax ferrireducens]
MNRQRYRLVFNTRLGALVAVAESARGRGKAASGASRAGALLASVLLAAVPALAQKLPTASKGETLPSGVKLPPFVSHGLAGYQTSGKQAFVNQVGNKAILNWRDFNIAPGHGVEFRQVDGLATGNLVPGASFTTLNRIWDEIPSVIYGSISQGAGQKGNIILVNSNGIAFMGGSQVNLNSFTASSLNIADKYITDRLLGDITQPQFQNDLDGNEARGFVKVFEGASITAASQGRVMLIAPTVINRGTIEAPDGQIILAAGTKAYLRSDDLTNNLNLRGLLVEVDKSSVLDNFNTSAAVLNGKLDDQVVNLQAVADDKLGHASNFGTLAAAHGNVTMVGYAVNQRGIARATSSVVANGSVYLTAKDDYVVPSDTSKAPASSRGGQVILGAGSLTEVLPDVADATTTVDGETGTGPAAPSEIRVFGEQVYLAAGSTIKAPSGEVSLTAAENPSLVLGNGQVTPSDALTLASSPARVHVAAGALIDVAGLRNVQVSAGRNTLEVELRGDELKDSPLNQTGALRGEKAWVDIEQALANSDAGLDTLIARDSLEAYQQRLERGIAERSTRGGSVILDSQGSVIVENGATIDLSGGSVDYQRAAVKTTVLGSQGEAVDLADAVATTKYDDIVSRFVIDYGRWNKKEVIELPNARRLVRAYTEGKDAGTLRVFSPGAAYLQPNIVGSTVSGRRQLVSGVAPRGAQFIVGKGGSAPGEAADNALNQKVVIDRFAVNLPGDFGMGSDLPEQLKDALSISADLLAEDRVAELALLTRQAAEVRSSLRAPQGGAVSLTASDISVQADIVAAGGKIGLAARNSINEDSLLTVADGVKLSVAGTWVNHLPGIAAAATAPQQLDGGSISLSASSSVEAGDYVGEGRITLAEDVMINASGGAMMDVDGILHEGKGGSIGISALRLEGLEKAQLTAYGFSEGGELSLSTRQITIGGALPALPVAGELHLAPAFFTQGGFAQYDLLALEQLDLADGATVRPVVAYSNLNSDFFTKASGASMADVSTPVVRDLLQREATSVSLSAIEQATDTGTLRIGDGARIEVDSGGTINLQARKVLDIEGALVARGGNIEATLVAQIPNAYSSAIPQGNLWLGQSAVLDASGTAQTYQDALGQTQGEVLAGGVVSLRADTGAMVAVPGSRIDVSGAAPVWLDERNELGGIGRRVASDAGKVNLAFEDLRFDGTLQAAPGSSAQRGGTLAMSTAREIARLDNQKGFDTTPLAIVLHNTIDLQTASLVPTLAPGGAGGTAANIATDPLEAAGFERMRFNSQDGIVLAEGLDLGNGATDLRELQLDASRIETRGNARLSADAVRLGNYYAGNRVGTAGNSVSNGGVLTAQARLLELAGDLRLQGMKRSALTGSELVQLSGVTHQTLSATGNPTGTFRHSAAIETTGSLTLRGGVVAPGGFAQVQVKAGHDVRIESSGATPIVPISALGSLSIEAQNITQAGYLAAPLGQISLDAKGDLILAAGSVTTVAGASGQTYLLGQVLNGVDWLVNIKPDDQVNGQAKLASLPGKEIRLSGDHSLMVEAATREQAAARLDLSGGSDLTAYEFTVGPGGTYDILEPFIKDAGGEFKLVDGKKVPTNVYAVLPGYQSGFAPDDAQESTGLAVGEAIFLNGVKGLADGTYTLLPAHYALLPGALAVRLGSNADLSPGQSATRQDGIQVVAGYLTDTRNSAPRAGDWQAVEVFTRAQVRARSEITLSNASDFFANTSSVPQDAGLLSLQTKLGHIVLDGAVQSAAAAGGKGLAVDISAPELIVTSGNSTNIDSGDTVLSVERLNAMNASSLLLGATRTRDGNQMTLDVGADNLTLDNDAQHVLKAAEVMLAANKTLTIGSGSVIDAQGADGDAGSYSIVGNGAFVRAASSTATFTRTGRTEKSNDGALRGAADSLVQAAKSIILDATEDNVVAIRDNGYAGQISFKADGKAVAGQLGIGAARIGLGEPAVTPNGIVLGQDELDAFQGLDSLSLTSYSTFDLYGDVSVGGLDGLGRPLTRNLILQGAGLAGMDNAGRTADLRAQNLTLSNTAGEKFEQDTGQTLGNGTLNVLADTLTLGNGSKEVAGFGNVLITAGELIAAGTGDTKIKGETSIATARLGGQTGAKQTLNAAATTDKVTVMRLEPVQPLVASTSVGASWTVNASEIAFDTRASLASGKLIVNATIGDITLGAHADIDVAGQDVAFFDLTRGTWGGEVTLNSSKGKINTAVGSRINVSGGAGADGGTLTASAVNGSVNLENATLLGTTKADQEGKLGEGARVRIDAVSLGNFSVLNAALNAAGTTETLNFSGERTVRARTGALSVGVGDQMQAEAITLTADTGALTVAGTVSASGAEGGQVGLYGKSVVLTGTGRIEAKAMAVGGSGGRVEIGAATAAEESNDITRGIDLQSRSVPGSDSGIDVSGGMGGVGGEVHLRAQRQGNEVAVKQLASAITGAREVVLEAVKVYNNRSTLNATGASADAVDVEGVSIGKLSLADINSDNTKFANADRNGDTVAGISENFNKIRADLGQVTNDNFHIVTGVEVRSSGDMKLGDGTAAKNWNLKDSAAGGEAGVLTLRAGGNLNIKSNLSDGFVEATVAVPAGNPATSQLLPNTTRGGRSWAYNLVAGADATSANVMNTAANTADLSVDADRLVRTGTGDIRMAAGNNITLADKSTVYTAGVASGALGSSLTDRFQRAFFTTGGGDVSMTAGNHVKGTASSQLYSDWLFRQGRLTEDGGAYATTSQGQLAWWVRFDQFAQGVGALGGGDVSISAGGNVSNLSASAPTQGRMTSSTLDVDQLIRTGGGDVTVLAGGDILSGQYFADKGDVRLVAGGAVVSDQTVNQKPVYTLLALGDGQAYVRAQDEVNVGAILNPQLLVQSYGSDRTANIGAADLQLQRASSFSTYGEASAARLASLVGPTTLHENLTDVLDAYATLLKSAEYGKGYSTLLNYLPGSLFMTAFSDDVVVKGAPTLLPSAQGQMELLAQGNVAIDKLITISDNDPAQIATVLRPTADATLVLAPSAKTLHATVPVHSGDTTTAKIYAVAGDVLGGSSTTYQLDLAKAVEVRAGGDVANLSARIQHANASDASLVEAGRDVYFSPGAQRTENAGIRLSGLGSLEVSAGRDVNLGTSGGLVSRGDLDNNNLPQGGADIRVFAGVNKNGFDAPDTLARLADRVASGNLSDTDLWLARWLTGNSDLAAAEVVAAVAVVQSLDPVTQREKLRDMLFTALSQTGRDANLADSAYAGNFDRGYAALELVFPGISNQDANGQFTKYEGSVNLFASRIKTERGGDIDILVPGGGLIVGLANTSDDLTNVNGAGSLGALGVVTAAAGDVRAFTREDMLVNQSRILTVGGGDILLWSSEGDIDAGKGKKTAATVPPPIIRIDAQGNVVLELQGAASGSGIGALSTGGVAAGDVDLIAPKGTVNAGDAGIRAGNLNIAAQIVLGADNISVSGTSAGTPVADTSAVTAASSGATSGGDDTGKVVAALNAAAADSAKAAQELAAALKPSVVRVEVLGYGE